MFESSARIFIDDAQSAVQGTCDVKRFILNTEVHCFGEQPTIFAYLKVCPQKHCKNICWCRVSTSESPDVVSAIYSHIYCREGNEDGGLVTFNGVQWRDYKWKRVNADKDNMQSYILYIMFVYYINICILRKRACHFCDNLNCSLSYFWDSYSIHQQNYK